MCQIFISTDSLAVIKMLEEKWHFFSTTKRPRRRGFARRIHAKLSHLFIFIPWFDGHVF